MEHLLNYKRIPLRDRIILKQAAMMTVNVPQFVQRFGISIFQWQSFGAIERLAWILTFRKKNEYLEPVVKQLILSFLKMQ